MTSEGPPAWALDVELELLTVRNKITMELQAIVRLERLGQLRNPMTSEN
jgi:hypothetical protein